MGLIHADIELTNGADASLFRKGIIAHEEIKRTSVIVIVRDGYHPLTINENIQLQLQVPAAGKKSVQFADGSIVDCDVVAPIELRHKDHTTTTSAIVLPADSQPGIGATLLDDSPVRLPFKLVE
jgi:hypothetical protein